MLVNSDKLSELWASNLSACDPVAENIKYFYPDEHQRYYTLPEAKRYADNAEEKEIILFRYNALLDEISNSHGSRIIVILPSSGNLSHEELTQSIGGIDDLMYWKTIDIDPDESNPAMKDYRQLYFKSLTWNSGLLNELMEKVSEEENWGVIIAPEDFSYLYLPYDGGIDLIIRSPEERAALSAKYSDWFESDPALSRSKPFE